MRHVLVNFLTIVVGNIPAILVGLVATFLRLDPVASLIRLVLALVIGHLVTLAIRLLHRAIFLDGIAFRFLQVFASGGIIGPDFLIVALSDPVLFADLPVLVHANVFSVLLLSILVGLVAVVSVQDLAHLFVLCLAFLLSVGLTKPLKLFLAVLSILDFTFGLVFLLVFDGMNGFVLDLATRAQLWSFGRNSSIIVGVQLA